MNQDLKGDMDQGDNVSRDVGAGNRPWRGLSLHVDNLTLSEVQAMMEALNTKREADEADPRQSP